ncbi:MAG: urease accessory protein UreD [Nitrospiria bacterium]
MAPSKGWRKEMHGLLDVRFERKGERTIAREVRQRAPLKVLRSLYPEGDSPSHLYILNASGGVLAGDRMEVSLHLEERAEVVVTMPAAARIHPMPSGDARQKLRFYLGRGSVLEYIPEPLLPFSGAAFLQEIEIFLEEWATLFWTDILGPGRFARGESFAYRLYENRMKISDRAGLVSQESFRLIPREAPINILGVMEGYSHMGSLYLFCADDALEGLLDAFRSIEVPGLYWGATLLSRRGLVVRVLAHDTPTLQDFFIRLWACFRREVMGRSLPPVRRY